ncbi:hypothetical protein FRC12_012165 [Ceratobasidium sp. 428]|nr:hypothetical protein FRC12_012165 [Ceratobasidium sp. 428]
MGLLPHVSPDEVFEQLGNPGQLDQQSISRFNFYAPLVRKITVAPTEEETKVAWRFLLRRVPRHPLLPRLRQLALDIGWYRDYEPLEALTCTMALLCPSLVEISGPSHRDAWIEPPLASLLLQVLAQTAPDLEGLRLLVFSQKQVSYAKSSLFSNLAAFRNLRALQCSTAMIDSPVLSLLGTLSELQSLIINAPTADNFNSERDNGAPEDNLSLEDLVLPPHSFPKLRHLNVLFLPCEVVSQLWNSAPLVQQLISVDVCFHPDADTPSNGITVNDTICDICRGSPDTIELCLDAYDVQYIELSTAAIDCLRQLSLHRLKLQQIYLPVSFGDISLLVTAAHDLEYLEMDRVDASFDALVLIAQRLPKLRFLVANITLTGWPYDLEEYSITPSPSALRLGSEFMFSGQTGEYDLDEGESMEDYVDRMAQHLHTLWPDGITCKREDTGEIPEDSDEKYFTLLKSRLKALNPPEFELPAREVYQAAWLYQCSY